MRAVLVGAVDSTRVTLEAWARHGAPPVLLLTLPLDLAARHSDFVDLRPTAGRYGVPVEEVHRVNAPEVIARIRGLEPDVLLVAGWSQICSAELLGAARHGGIGYHPAPLPELRGRAVIPWTILTGREQTGSTLFWMDEGVDSGDILAQTIFAVCPDETAESLYAKHIAALTGLWDSTLPRLLSGERPRSPQDHSGATYCARRTQEDGRIDWSRPAREIWTLVRAAGRPYPGAFTTLDGRKVTVWSAELVEGAPYIGLPGQIQRVDECGVLVQCGDGEHVLLTEIGFDGEENARAEWPVRLHQRLGAELVVATGLS